MPELHAKDMGARASSPASYEGTGQNSVDPIKQVDSSLPQTARKNPAALSGDMGARASSPACNENCGQNARVPGEADSLTDNIQADFANPSIALVLCSYNKKHDTLNCIESIFKSSINNFDLIVVDNASSDGISDEIINTYQDKINLIINKENNGAGAGFNTGIRYALTKNYKYIMTVDHDVLFEENTIKVLYDFLEGNDDAAIAGSKFCYMDRPNIIQWFGLNFYSEEFKTRSEYAGHEDNDRIPEVYFCDDVPLGAMMVRKEAVLKVGLLDESFFLYEEDFDWCLRFKKAGYKTVVCSKSKVLHKYGLSEYTKGSTFGTYYFRRNQCRLFLKYLPDDLIEKYCKYILKDLFQGIYSCGYSKKYNAMKTLVFAVDDALNNVFGKAKEGRIFETDKIENRFEKLVSQKNNIILKCNYSFPSEKLLKIRNMVKNVKFYNNKANIFIQSDDPELNSRISDVRIISISDIEKIKECLVLNLCEHIFNIKAFNDNEIYVDLYLNVVENDNDRDYCLKFDQNFEFFYQCNFHTMLTKAKELRAKWASEKAVVQPKTAIILDYTEQLISDIGRLSRNKDTYIWGAGHYGVLTALNLELKGEKVSGFIDQNAKNIKTRLGLPVLTPSSVISDNVKIIITVQNGEAIKNITENLISRGVDFIISPILGSILDLDYYNRFKKECEIKNYFYSYNEDVNDPEIFEIIDYFKKGNEFSVFPYEFSRRYSEEDIDIFLDDTANAYYVKHENKKLYFPEEWDINQVRSYYNSIRIEQDNDSPHRYECDWLFAQDGDVIADVGAAEGIWAFNYVEKAERIYLFECEDKWIKALQKTFAPWKEKVTIINKYVSDTDDCENISLDSFFNNKQIDFIKADVEGMEIKLLEGSRDLLSRNCNLKLLLCAYHNNGDEEEIIVLLKNNGFQAEVSKRYMLYIYDKELTKPYYRRGLVRALKRV